MLRKIIIAVSFLLNILFADAQYLPVNTARNNVYSFIDELACDQIIDIPTLIYPRSRIYIAELLRNADTGRMSSRQIEELEFYLKDYNKEIYPHKDFNRRLDMLYLRDSSFSLTINPIGGGNLWAGKNRTAYHWWNGLYAGGYAGNWSFYASLKDNHESEQLMKPSFLTQEKGGAGMKMFSGGKQDYWEAKGGVAYSWKTGHLGLLLDNFTWGSGYNGTNIFSGRTPAFTHLSFNLRPAKWLELNYVHGWLVSEVIDSSQSFWVPVSTGIEYRTAYHRKFIAANMFTFKPFKTFYISAGNSIIYDYKTAHPVFFIPVLFYKAVDQHLNSLRYDMNSQFFMDISARMIPHTHIYFSGFVDEMATSRILNPDEHNFLSFKGGIRVSNLPEGTYAGIEYTWTNVNAFRHYIPTHTFESNRYNLGHYLTDNAQEIFLTAGYRPYRGMDVNVSYNRALKGPDHNEAGERLNQKPFVPVVWESDAFRLDFSWQVLNDLWVRLGYRYQNVRGEETYVNLYTPDFWKGKTSTWNIGLSFGN